MNKDNRLRINYTNEEIQIVKDKAKLLGISMSTYIRKVSVNSIFNVDWEELKRLNKNIIDMNNSILHYCALIERTNQWNPEDLNIIKKNTYIVMRNSEFIKKEVIKKYMEDKNDS